MSVHIRLEEQDQDFYLAAPGAGWDGGGIDGQKGRGRGGNQQQAKRELYKSGGAAARGTLVCGGGKHNRKERA